MSDTAIIGHTIPLAQGVKRVRRRLTMLAACGEREVTVSEFELDIINTAMKLPLVYGGFYAGMRLVRPPKQDLPEPNKEAAVNHAPRPRATVHAIHARGRVGKDTLHEMAADPNLESFQVVCFWKDGGVTTGWPGGMKSSDLVFGGELLREDVRRWAFPEGESD